VLNDQEELAFREAAFAWIRAQQLTKPYFTREDLSEFSYGGTTHRLIGLFTGIWKVTAPASDNSTAVLLVVLVAAGVAVLVGARVLKARKQQQP